MTIPEPEPQYHRHKGVDCPVKTTWAYLRNPGEEPEWVEMGLWCPYCGFTETPVAVRMHLEIMMGWKEAEEVEPPDLVG